MGNQQSDTSETAVVTEAPVETPVSEKEAEPVVEAETTEEVPVTTEVVEESDTEGKKECKKTSMCACIIS